MTKKRPDCVETVVFVALQLICVVLFSRMGRRERQVEWKVGLRGRESDSIFRHEITLKQLLLISIYQESSVCFSHVPDECLMEEVCVCLCHLSKCTHTWTHLCVSRPSSRPHRQLNLLHVFRASINYRYIYIYTHIHTPLLLIKAWSIIQTKL